jgi:hypothetical protein
MVVICEHALIPVPPVTATYVDGVSARLAPKHTVMNLLCLRLACSSDF